MAAAWMKAKLLKAKRDGIRDSRGPYERFSTNPAKHTPRDTRKPGWYVAGQDKRESFGCSRGLPRSFGPFPTKAEARRVGRAMFTDESLMTFQI